MMTVTRDNISARKCVSSPAFYLAMGASALAALIVAVALASTRATGSPNFTLPPGAVYINPLEYNVLGADYAQWRTNDSFVGFNPTNTTPPFIQVFDSSFLDITGPDATIRLVSSHPGFAFAHEAPIYVPDLNVVFFSSNDGGSFGYSSWYNNSVVSMLNMTEVDIAIASITGNVNVPAQTLNLSDTVQMVNGGTGPYKGNLLFITSGRALLPPSIVLVNPNPPFNTTVLLDNFYGRQFSALNDIKVLPGTDIMFFTDPTYGWLFDFRPEPMIPSQVYRFDPSTGQVRVVADQFVHPNGIAFTPDGRTAFVTDTGAANGLMANNQTYPATIYQYDVDPVTQSFTNRRVFAYSDTGIPDGIQLDTNGNVYSGCGDGTHVWSSQGTLIGKFFVNTTSAEMIFTKSGLLIFAEESIYLANIQAQGIDLEVY
ncbi:calcium-dependent phosphotriesterase [Boletus reticuloceps]|uniref:Calcium-dependent phosphotriesterase n=1 Tax=Boletus reticuloceps TaxID=495285 RepID=A0A8I2YK80_9AGAM|nr:calcium-dependent phosphotriesterase [Boletus reticuloceps]